MSYICPPAWYAGLYVTYTGQAWFDAWGEDNSYMNKMVGLRHYRNNYGFNDVFCDGHAETVTAYSHYDWWNSDDSYWALDP